LLGEGDCSALAALHHVRMLSIFSVVEEDLGFWVRPRSTTWFSRFVVEEFEDDRWIQCFQTTKRAVFSLAEMLRPQIQRRDTRYRLAIPVLVRVCCTLFKLAQGCSIFICFEFFAVGKTTVSQMLRDTVYAINETLRHKLTWPNGQKLLDCQLRFRDLCGMPGLVGAIDGMHVAISKPQFGAEGYYYFKSSGYSLNCQAVVDSHKCFMDLYLGMLGSTNNSRILRRSSLYHLAQQNTLFDTHFILPGFASYLVGDSGFPLLPWLMTPHNWRGNFGILENLFNRKLRHGHCVVENAFGLLKQTFRELLGKSSLRVTFLPDVILYCAILHNVLLEQSNADVEQLLEVLRLEGFQGEVLDEGDAR
jgi:hypothetical protein